MRLRFFLAAASIAMSPLLVSAQDSGLSFLTLGIDAQALAKGDAGVATSSGAFASYWNPAGLAGTESEIGVSHHVWIGDIRTYGLNGAFRVGERSGIGVSIVATGAGSLEAREQPGSRTACSTLSS